MGILQRARGLGRAVLSWVLGGKAPAEVDRVRAVRVWNDGGRLQHRGGPGNRAVQRAAVKKRNQARHRRAVRG